MLGQITRSSSSTSDSRIFVYEVTGLRQTEQTENSNYPIRTSDSIFIQVPHHRMNDEMRRIARLGGKIVGIHSLSDFSPNHKSSPPDAAATETSEN